jgi:hypothetical protein
MAAHHEASVNHLAPFLTLLVSDVAAWVSALRRAGDVDNGEGRVFVNQPYRSFCSPAAASPSNDRQDREDNQLCEL